MLAVPLPFIASLLFIITALLVRPKSNWLKSGVFWFSILCAAMTTVVGLRWTFDIALLRCVQPVLGAMLPVAAWLCFSKTQHVNTKYLHWLGPIIVAIASINPSRVWLVAIDIVLICLYLAYGLLLIKESLKIPTHVRLNQITTVLFAQRAAGFLLLMSALIDGMISYDLIRNSAAHINLILSFSYLALIAGIVTTVTTASQHTVVEPTNNAITQPSLTEIKSSSLSMSKQEATQICDKLSHLLTEKELYKDVDLTLARLSKRLGVPAKPLSQAINQVYGENISRVINSFRIEHAKSLLLTSNMSITEVYLASGFQTKSNFHREFSRITGQTPSGYRSSLS
ncbi:AraC family transcriptional regulator [Vibrio metschnikovii]|uniref:helix-turn-helix domain-containing protein n=1 Tax=Vibrio metschnikovii TaxID=28172 RepID=UPI002FCBD55F